MTTGQLLQRNLTYFWRTNLAVIAGVAIAVSVLAGALLVGDSVRGSLRDLFLLRLGNTDHVVTSEGFFREQLARDIQNHPEFSPGEFAAAAPLIALEGSITHEASRTLGTGISVYGVDERFWTFHGQPHRGPLDREILVSDGLARELGSTAGDALLLRVQKPSEIPVESLHSKKEDLGSTLRLTMRESLSSAALGEFSVQPRQGATRAVFVPLKSLQKELDQDGKANLILVNENSRSEADATRQSARKDLLVRILKDTASFEDYGIQLRVLDEQKALSVESSAGFIPESLAERVKMATQSADTSGAVPYLSYLINSILRDDKREIPYSTVTGVDAELLDVMQHGESWHVAGGCDFSEGKGTVPATAHLPPIMLNEWAGSDLQVKLGERVTLDYYVWLAEGKLATRSAEFRVACIIPMKGLAADRDLVPDYPGITESETLGDWDPPFPIDLKRIRPQDEEYWKKYRATPKGFIPLTVGQELWQTRFGKVTSLRVWPKRGRTLAETHLAFDRVLRETLDPLHAGFSILPVRAQGLEASRGATNFGEYFLYFSFFLVISALLLTALFFKLGVEQRLREIGLLQAIGYPASRVRKLFLFEGIVISILGSLIGLAGALAYGKLMMTGLSTWWVEAVGTTMLKLHVAPISLLLGAVGGVVAALVCIVWTLRRFGKASSRSLLMGTLGDAETRRRADGEPGRSGDTEMLGHSKGSTTSPRRPSPSPRLLIAFALTLLGLVILLLASFQLIEQTAGFFGAGLLLLAAALCYQSVWLR
ncbi:MAG: ABC transporter permease, partial [Pyrinomonadaceae bacterium]|nr:ABC transporter permease [Pyrinomonadaceae bacterium]